MKKIVPFLLGKKRSLRPIIQMQENTTTTPNKEIAEQINRTNASCEKLLQLCDQFLKTAKVDEGHGISHICAVLKHVDSALLERTAGPGLTDFEVLAVRCAAILHDVDDHKFFDSSDTFSNASFLLNQINELSTLVLDQPFQELENLVKTMIGLVSCSTNGNSNPLKYPDWMLYPRIADRLEAIGEIGITRALQYGEYRNRLMYDEHTERVTSIEELNRLANKERFDRYLAGERSETTIGHFYDKIVHIGDYTEFGVRNPYFDRVAAARKKQVEEWLLKFWQTLA
jgi:uncharacterized protein